ncbi:MAG: hypothetical protein ACOCVT_03030 [bacterium]
MIEIRNRTFQPLVFYLPQAKKSLHLGPRQVQQITRKDLTPETEKAEGEYTHAAFNSSYAALHSPWIEIPP